MQKGILLVNKPIGYSTFDVIRDFKRITSFKGKIGHAGTLDVFANGLIILLINTTKSFSDFQQLTKYYQASVRLGVSSITLDIEGELIHQPMSPKPSRSDINSTLESFIGSYEQSIPAYSAAKFKGQPLYKHAQKGELLTHKSKPVTIYTLNLIAYKYPLVTLAASCSSGTYIRQLTVDLFNSLGIDSFLFGLTRTQIGEYHLHDALDIKDLSLWESKLINIKS